MSSKKSINIDTPEDLLKFLDVENLDISLANKVANVFLGTTRLYDLPIDELRQAARNYIVKFLYTNDKPLFIFQKEKDFHITDIYNLKNQ